MINKLPSPSSTFRIYIILFLGGLLFTLNGHFSTMQDIVISTFITSVIVFTTKFFKHQDNIVIGIVLIVLVGYISYLTIALGSGLQNIEQLVDASSRIELLFQNPNFLASFLLMTSTSVLVLLRYSSRYRYISVIALPLVGAALIFTGSRAALTIFVILFFHLYLHALIMRDKMFVYLFSSLICLGLTLYPIVMFINQKSQALLDSPNLLRQSEDFIESGTPYRNAFVTTKKAPQLSPSGYNTFFIAATSPNNTSLFFLKDIKTSAKGEDYIASVYLKSETLQKIFLSTHLSSTVCDIGLDWSRCTTPVAKGDGYLHVQFRFETLEPNQSVEFYFAEPQLEIGTQATPYQPRAYPNRLYWLSKRLSTNVFSTDNKYEGFLAGRPEAWHKGWRLFLQHPLLGVGSGNFTKYEDTDITHSHNIFIQILATQGLVGFAMWFAVGFIMLSSMTARQRRDFFPMLMVAFLMNLTDYTFIHASSLYIFFFTWGCVYFNKIYPEAENKELVRR